MASVAIYVNPMAGRDVRRVAARASTMTFEAKRDAVARIAAGADAAGATDIFVVEEPFRLATMALQWMQLAARLHVLKTPITNTAADTEAAVAAFLDAGATTIVSLGGDGTNRIIARAAKNVDLVPLSTGTNNVFPVLAEPTLAGMAAGLAARGLLPAELRPRCKLLHVAAANGAEDVAVVDAVLLADDFTGNLRQFDADRLRRILLLRAEPDAIGTSPIGGFLDVVTADDDCGLLLETTPTADSPPAARVYAPLSPGWFRTVKVVAARRIPFDEPVRFEGTGVLALDGDREHKLAPAAPARVCIRRDGPRVLRVGSALRYAARQGLLAAHRAPAAAPK